MLYVCISTSTLSSVSPSPQTQTKIRSQPLPYTTYAARHPKPFFFEPSSSPSTRSIHLSGLHLSGTPSSRAHPSRPLPFVPPFSGLIVPCVWFRSGLCSWFLFLRASLVRAFLLVCAHGCLPQVRGANFNFCDIFWGLPPGNLKRSRPRRRSSCIEMCFRFVGGNLREIAATERDA